MKQVASSARTEATTPHVTPVNTSTESSLRKLQHLSKNTETTYTRRVHVTVEEVLAYEKQTLMYANVPMQGTSATRISKAETLIRTHPHVEVFMLVELGLRFHELQIMAKRLDLNVFASDPSEKSEADQFLTKVFGRPYTCILAKRHVPITDYDAHPNSMATSVQLGKHWVTCVYSHAQAGVLRKQQLAKYLQEKGGMVVGDFNPASSSGLIELMRVAFPRELVQNQQTFFRKGAHNYSLDRLYLMDSFPLCGWDMAQINGFDHGVITMFVKAFEDEIDVFTNETNGRTNMLRFSKSCLAKFKKSPMGVDELFDAIPKVAHSGCRTDKSIRRKKKALSKARALGNHSMAKSIELAIAEKVMQKRLLRHGDIGKFKHEYAPPKRIWTNEGDIVSGHRAINLWQKEWQSVYDQPAPQESMEWDATDELTVSGEEVYEAARTLKDHAVTKDFSVSVFKHLHPSTYVHLASMYQQWINGNVPKRFEDHMSDIIMIPKPGKKKPKVLDYRPISIISAPQKLLHTILKNKMQPRALTWLREVANQFATPGNDGMKQL